MALKGLNEMIGKLDKIITKTPDKMQGKVLDVALGVFGEAISNAPVETGHLRESGYCEMNGIQVARGSKDGPQVLGGVGAAPSDKIIVKIGFSADYALVQHERTGGGKYLEKAIVEGSDQYKAALARELLQ